MRKKIFSLFLNEFVQGGFFLTVSSILINLLNYFFHFFSARILGPSGYGEIITLFSYTTLTSVPITVFSMIIIQKISVNDKNKTEYAYALEKHLWMKAKKWWFLILPLIVIIPFMPRLTNLSPLIAYLIIPFMISGFVSIIYNSIFQGLRFFLFFSLIGLLAAVLKLLSIIPPLFNIGDAKTVALFYFISGLVVLAVQIQVIKTIFANIKEKPQKIIIKRTLLKFILDPQFFMTLFSVLAMTILSNFDIIYVKKFYSSFEAGIFGSWSMFAKMILYITGPMIQVGYVFFAGNSNKHLQEKILLFSVGVLFITGLSAYFGYQIFGEILIKLLFGNRFIAVMPYLGQACFFGSLYTLITLFNNYFLAKKNKFSLLLFSLIPIYMILLFILPKNISTIMNLDILFSLSAVILYLLAFLLQKNQSSIL